MNPRFFITLLQIRSLKAPDAVSLFVHRHKDICHDSNDALIGPLSSPLSSSRVKFFFPDYKARAARASRIVEYRRFEAWNYEAPLLCNARRYKFIAHLTLASENVYSVKGVSFARAAGRSVTMWVILFIVLWRTQCDNLRNKHDLSDKMANDRGVHVLKCSLVTLHFWTFVLGELAGRISVLGVDWRHWNVGSILLAFLELENIGKDDLCHDED